MSREEGSKEAARELLPVLLARGAKAPVEDNQGCEPTAVLLTGLRLADAELPAELMSPPAAAARSPVEEGEEVEPETAPVLETDGSESKVPEEDTGNDT